jgi:hypothetical protein
MAGGVHGRSAPQTVHTYILCRYFMIFLQIDGGGMFDCRGAWFIYLIHTCGNDGKGEHKQ